MKQKLSLISSAVLLAAASQASAQGLNSIGYNLDRDFAHKMPFSWYIGAQIGYDSNPLAVEHNVKSSTYIAATIGADYNTGDRKRTALDFHISYSPLFYLDAPRGLDDSYNNARASIDWRHRVNPRLTLTDSAYLAYEIEPNFGIGATIARRTDQYFYGFNSLAAAYSWTRRFSTVTSYTISGVAYDSGAENGEDYLTHIFANEFRYAYTRRTTAALTYRYAIGNYDNGFGDYTSQYLLVGLDHKFNPRLTGSFRVGAEFRDRDHGGNETDPYFEGSMTYLVSRRTDVRAYSRIGFQDSDIGGFGDRYGYRFGVTASHRINSRLSGSLGAHYIHDEFSQGFPGSSFDEDVIALSLGLEYAIWKNVSLNCGYSYTTTSNDSNGGFRPEYDRHNVQFGFNARF
jgi:opacity protein-like surface antigen